MRAPVSPYIVVVRIASVLGMAFALATAILLAIAGPEYWLWAFLAFLAFFPFLGLMVFVERYREG
ncbi:MAG TPA: hypothetical protein VIO14_05605 [Dehalococcoidia bacterium]